MIDTFRFRGFWTEPYTAWQSRPELWDYTVNPADVPRPAGETTQSGPRPAARAAQGIRAHENASEGSGQVELAPNKRLHPTDRT